MSRARNRLGTVLRVRRIEEEAARGRLVAAGLAVRGAEQTLTDRRTAYAGLGPLAAELTGAGLRAEHVRRTAYARSVTAATGALGEAREVQVGARDAWSLAAQRVSGAERLVARAAAARTAARLRAEQQAADETAAVRWQRGSR